MLTISNSPWLDEMDFMRICKVLTRCARAHGDSSDSS